MITHLQARVDALDAWRAHQSDLLDEHLNNHPDPHNLDPADDLDGPEINDTAIGGADLGRGDPDRRPAIPTIGGYALIEWAHDTVAAITARPLRGEYAWCPLWWEHPEAVFRFEALHGAWTELAPEPGAALSIWIRDHLDPCLHVLLSPNGPSPTAPTPNATAAAPTPTGHYQACPPPPRHDRPDRCPGQCWRRGPRGAPAARRAPPHHHHHNHDPRRGACSDQRGRAAPAGSTACPTCKACWPGTARNCPWPGHWPSRRSSPAGTPPPTTR